ncbi:hypothetical protein KUA23_00920 [Pseudomonas pergaminensis]|uniref:Uncharacterized protein n=1 Tax=Pseudomonas pergaminensis TaxID=2853159 RepID=A0ABD7TI61_9PSED|nr:hypothetical protein [Pseudomonas pergaminensis]USW01360.1 hypothetical protein KUA23_00920 [Pseudomonas pergaminensis]
MSNRNSISTPEIKAAQNKYASQRETLHELGRTKKQLAHKLTALVAENTLDKEAKASAHDKALKAYSAAIAAGDTAAEAEADTALQSILSESDRSRGKHLARTAAIAKLEQEVVEIDQRSRTVCPGVGGFTQRALEGNPVQTSGTNKKQR